MIFIDGNGIQIFKARKTFLLGMEEFVFKRIDKLKYCENIKSLANSNKRAIINFFDNFINDKIDKILTGTPTEIEAINAQINDFLSPSNDLYKAVRYVFNYELFITKAKNRYDAYNLANDLEIETCVYCNRNYTNTIITLKNEKVIRPQFDHFFDKDSNPLLALSFYNLIPSCSTCNSSIKHGKKFELGTHIHPYVDDILSEFKFTFDYSNKTRSGLKILINVPVGSKTERTFSDMSLQVVYNAHTDKLKDLLDIKYKFSDKYLSILSSNILSGFKLSQKELYRLAFASELEEKDFYKKPFSKFKNDILRELDIL